MLNIKKTQVIKISLSVKTGYTVSNGQLSREASKTQKILGIKLDWKSYSTTSSKYIAKHFYALCVVIKTINTQTCLLDTSSFKD